jgi:copper chaperone CopZ
MDANCHVEPIQKIPTPDERKNLTTVGLAVWGMGCPNCSNRVRNSLLALTGVVEADVDHTTGFALVEYSPSLVSVPFLLQAVARAGNDGRHKYVAMLFEEATL